MLDNLNAAINDYVNNKRNRRSKMTKEDEYQEYQEEKKGALAGAGGPFLLFLNSSSSYVIFDRPFRLLLM
jgi:hypothetical protein